MLEHPPETSSAARTTIHIISTSSRGCAVGQGAVDQEIVGSVNNGNSNQGLVQRRVAAVSNQVVDIGAVGVFVATARGIRIASAGDVAGLVLVRGLVVVCVQVVVGVHVGAIEPDGRPDGEKTYTGTESKGSDAGW